MDCHSPGKRQIIEVSHLKLFEQIAGIVRIPMWFTTVNIYAVNLQLKY